MSKSAREWAAEWCRDMFLPDEKFVVEFLEKVQADARAGMVPEGECTHVGKRTELWDRLHEKLNAATVEHEAELAKAWEAGRDAAATKVDNWNGDGEDNPSRLRATGSMIRALQPPGGKPK